MRPSTQKIVLLPAAISVLLMFLIAPALAHATETPTEIAGISLGSNVNSYPSFTQSNFLKEVVVTDWHGFRKGVISYGACKYIDQILKIDLKYEQKDKAFYTKLLKTFKGKFGEPDLWKGDSFGVVHIWKWYFTDEQKNRVSLILQHNSKNSSETIGNMVKLSYPDKIAEEQLCFADVCKEHSTKTRKEIKERPGEDEWSLLIPR